MGKTVAKHEPIAWMDAMRLAVFDAVNAHDIAEITSSIVQQAKDGDLRAAEFLFRYVIGSPAIKVHQQHTVEREREVIDVTERNMRDPSPNTIAEAAKKIRIAHGHKRDTDNID